MEAEVEAHGSFDENILKFPDGSFHVSIVEAHER